MQAQQLTSPPPPLVRGMIPFLEMAESVVYTTSYETKRDEKGRLKQRSRSRCAEAEFGAAGNKRHGLRRLVETQTMIRTKTTLIDRV